MRSAIFLALTVMLGATLAINPSVTALIEKCQASSFGKTLYGTLELELSSGQPGQYLVNLLEGMKTTLHNDIVRANETHTGIQAHCTEDITSLQEEIASHAKNVLESNKIISTANQKLSWDKVELENNQRQLAEAKDSLVKTEKIRADEAVIFEQKNKELNQALDVLHQGHNLIQNNLVKQGSLIQVGKGFSSYVQEMSVKLERTPYRGRGFIALISILADLSSNQNIQAKAEGVQKVLGLIQSIIEEVEKAKNIEYQAEEERINNYHQIVELLEKRIAELSRTIDKLTNSINSLTVLITQNKARVAENVRSIQIKKRQQIKRKKECTAENKQFLKEAAIREENFNLVDEALLIINQNIEEFRKIVLENSEAGIQKNYQQ